MKKEQLLGKKIGIFGFGAEGESLLDYFIRHSISDVVVLDEGGLSDEKIDKIKQSRAKLILGEFRKENCLNIDIAFRSPGLKFEKIKNLLPEGIQISSLTNLFFAEHKGKIVAVTGTKGKSTTVGLIAEVLKQNGVPYFIGGNIGVSPLGFVDETNENTISVLELSSFQLEDLQYAPDVAVILPLYLDHLDYHQHQGISANYHSKEEDYLNAKGRIVENMKTDGLIVAYDAPNIQQIISQSPAMKINFSEKSVERGCFFQDEDIKCVNFNGEKKFSEILKVSKQHKIIPINTLAAMTFAYVLGLEVDIQGLFTSYKKLPYRIEKIGEIGGIQYFNDSAATNPISTIEAMGTMDDKYALIMGGSSKDLRFNNLAKEAAKDSNLVKIFLIGQTADEIENELKIAQFRGLILRKKDLKEVISGIRGGEGLYKNVLFSPASASFDQFKNYKDRGEAFNNLVRGQNG